jgi:inorganic pyrophosphatase
MGKRKKSNDPMLELNAVDEQSGYVNVLIDTPKGSRNKFKYDERLRLFKLGGVLAVGMSFPFDFGYIPATAGGDGDPLDVLILMDEPAFVGCLVETRLIGVIEAEQTEDGKTERNDRLIGVAVKSRVHEAVCELHELNEQLLNEIEHFFISYNDAKGKRFAPLQRGNADRAHQILEEGQRAAQHNS